MTTKQDVLNQAYISLVAMQADATTAVDTLTTAASGFTSTTITASPVYQAVLGAYDKLADSAAKSAVAGAFSAYDTAMAALAPGTITTAPDLDDFTTVKWNETWWTNLKSLLTTFTADITGGDDLDTVITKLSSETDKMQVTLYAAERERKQQGLRDAFSAADAATGARGFTYPNSMTTALKLSAQQQYMFDLSQASRELVKMLFEWAKSNYQFSIDKQLAAHGADVDFTVRYADMLVKVYSEEVRSVLQEYRDKVAGLVAKSEQLIKEHSLYLEVIKAEAAVDSEYDKAAVSAYSENIKLQMTTTAQAIQTAAETAKNKIAAGSAVISSLGSIGTIVSMVDVTTQNVV